MPKYVFDFDAVNNSVNTLRDEAANIRKSLSSSKSNNESELANWSGEASDAVKANNEASYKVLSEDVDTMEVMADYMVEASKLIQAAEDSLSSLKL